MLLPALQKTVKLSYQIWCYSTSGKGSIFKAKNYVKRSMTISKVLDYCFRGQKFSTKTPKNQEF